jgi:hypothetical protein
MLQTAQPTARAATPWRAVIEMAALVSVVAAAVAILLTWFLGLGEVPVVLGTIVGASWVGWRQPAMR